MREVGALLDAKALQGGRRARDHLLVIGKGRLIADTGVDEFVRSSSQQSVHVRSPLEEAFMELTRDSVECQAAGATR